MNVTIEAVVPRDDFSIPGKIKHMVDVSYSTDKGLQGKVTLPKDGISPDVIKAAVLADAAAMHPAIGMTFSK